jgi:septum formation protein
LSAIFVLASKSKARADMLRAAGVMVDIVPADIDERAVEAPAVARGAGPAEIARLLSVAKAQAVAALRPEAVVIGSDQTLALAQHRFSKPRHREEAAEQLRLLRGHTHILASGAALVHGDRLLWSGVDDVRVTMRAFSDVFLNAYLDRVGDAVTTTVGGYQIESLGVQLFDKIEGDYFSVLGLPLLGVLRALRDLGYLEA